jgi:carbonyl reductase 1
MTISEQTTNQAGTVALVTGANQGIGRAVVDRLAQVLGPDATVYLTGRNQERVERATAEVAAAAGTTAAVVPAALDVRDTTAVHALAKELRGRHGGVDIVVSNAAARITPQRTRAEQVREFVDTNNLGTTRMLRAFGPLLRPGGRFLVVASAFGSLRNLDPRLHRVFDTTTMTLDDLDRVMLDYADLVETGGDQAAGWPEPINIPSKIGQVAAARIFARDWAANGDARAGGYVGAVCPGLVDTPASRPWFADMSQAQTPDEAARDLVRLAIDQVDPRFIGELVQHGIVIPWT